jgi:hypothetical protein
MKLVVIVQGQANLPEIAAALGAPRRLTSLLHRGQEQRHENGGDRDDDEQLDQSETTTATFVGSDDNRSPEKDIDSILVQEVSRHQQAPTP